MKWFIPEKLSGDFAIAPPLHSGSFNYRRNKRYGVDAMVLPVRD